MIKPLVLLTLALPLMGAACQHAGIETVDTRGAGFSKMHPNAGTRDYIIKNDRPFAEEVVGHNRTCDRAPACVK